MSRRKKQGLARLWQLVTVLDRAHGGVSIRLLQEKLGVSRATLYRYLGDLDRAGVALERSTVAGELRLGLLGRGLPAIVPSPRQLAALHFARGALNAWQGAGVVEELDTLLARWHGRAVSRRQAEGAALR